MESDFNELGKKIIFAFPNLIVTLQQMKEQSKYKDVYKEPKILDNDIFSSIENPRGRPEYFMPKGTEVLELPSRLEIELDASSRSKRYKNNNAIVAIIVNFMAVAFFLIGIGGNLIVLLFMLPIVVFGLKMGVETLGLFFNKRTVTIEDEHVKITEAPFVIRQLIEDIHTQDIDQLFVQRYRTNLTVNGSPVYAHALYLIKKDGTRIKLLDNSNAETVLYLEQKIERHLGIVDRAVNNDVI